MERKTSAIINDYIEQENLEEVRKILTLTNNMKMVQNYKINEFVRSCQSVVSKYISSKGKLFREHQIQRDFAKCQEIVDNIDHIITQLKDVIEEDLKKSFAPLRQILKEDKEFYDRIQQCAEEIERNNIELKKRIENWYQFNTWKTLNDQKQ